MYIVVVVVYKDRWKRRVVDNKISCRHLLCPLLRPIDSKPSRELMFCKSDEKREKPSWITAAHGDELPFVLGYPFMGTKDCLFPYSFTDRDREVSMKVMKYWTNFAKTG